MSKTEVFQKLPAAKQDRIFQAAISEFAKDGYQQSSLNVVCRQAEISKGSLFQYFTNKQGLFQSIVDLAIDQVQSYLRQARDNTEQENFFTRLELLLRLGFQFIDEHPRLAKIYFNILQTNDSPFGSELVGKLNEKSCRFIEKLLFSGIAKGELRSDLNCQWVAFMINTLLEKLLRSYYSDFLTGDLGLYQADPEHRELWIKEVSCLLRNGITFQSER